MANRRISMINLVHLIRQLNDNIPYRDISNNLRISKTTVQNYSNLFKSLNLNLSELVSKTKVRIMGIIIIYTNTV